MDVAPERNEGVIGSEWHLRWVGAWGGLGEWGEEVVRGTREQGGR